VLVVVLFGCALAFPIQPVADSTGTLKVVVHYPHSQLSSRSSLYLRGDNLGLNWSSGIKIANTGSVIRTDQWEVDLSFSSNQAGKNLEMKVLVDDSVWMIGSNFITMIPNQTEKATTVNIYPWFSTYQGVYQYHKNIYSPQLKNIRDLVVYTPPSYYENTLKTIKHVLIMHDGQNLFNPSTAFMGNAWYCQDTVDQEVVAGNMDEIIIVGVDNTPDRINEYTYSYDPSEGAGGKGDLYLDFLIQTVIPFIQSKYRVVMTRENVGIMGSSLGGLISCYGGYTRPSSFSKAGCMSSSFWWNNEDFDNIILPKYTPPTDVTFYLDSGDSGSSQDDVTQTQTVRNHMLQLGYVYNQTLFYYLDHGASHSETYWGPRFWIPMVDLYPPSVEIPV
jgi:predicted alpha/beta superfamily hydrolase